MCMQWRHLFLLIAVLWKPFSFWMTAVPTLEMLTLRAHEWRANFLPSCWYAPLYSARTNLQLRCRFITSCMCFQGNYENSRSERMHIRVSLLRQMAQEQSLMSLWSWLQNLQQIWLITCWNELKSFTCIQLRYLLLDVI